MGLLVALYLALGLSFGTPVNTTKGDDKKPVLTNEIGTTENKPGDGDGW